MSAMQVIIIDDEPLAREGLRLMLDAHTDLEIVGEAGNGSDALALIERIRPDLVLIDMEMPEMNGLELAAALPAGAAGAIVFVTAHDELALGAFDVRALDYVLKPIDEARLALAIERAREQIQLADAAVSSRGGPAARPRPPERLTIRDGDRLLFLPIDEVDWIEAADYYVEIHAGGRSFLHRESLQRLAARLDGDRFVRIHRSRLVNRARIRELRRQGRGQVFVVLADGRTLRVARSCRARLEQAF